MTRLALLRHGDSSGRDLSPLGERQAAALGRQLRDLEPTPRQPRVVTSPAPRARQTASLVCSFLGLSGPLEERRLWSGPDGAPDSWENDPWWLLDRMEAWGRDVDLLVVITHLEICATLPSLLAEHVGLPGVLPPGLARGQGLYVDLAARSWRLLQG
ncbi:MAG: histidine phosphatase family protein [bacterium]|nr:histidine phosphatase family protein [bacterium]